MGFVNSRLTLRFMEGPVHALLNKHRERRAIARLRTSERASERDLFTRESTG